MRLRPGATGDARGDDHQYGGADDRDDPADPVDAVAAAVVHLAWGFQPSHDPDYLAALGIDGTRRVLSAAVSSSVPHLVHMSSVGVYSPKRDDRPVDESYPAHGVPSSAYSQHKAQAERVLDSFVEKHPSVKLARIRPGIIGQRSAGSALLRYALPALLPARLLRLFPVLPLDRSLRIPMVHADDVADAFSRVLAAGAEGRVQRGRRPDGHR